jgi:hypothetical protein
VAVRQRGQLHIIQGILRLNTGTAGCRLGSFNPRTFSLRITGCLRIYSFEPQAILEQLMSGT